MEKLSGQIFISYRRDESRWSARSLCDRLAARFDRNQIFMDVDAHSGIALGEDFLKAIKEKVGFCDVLISVIGKGWLTATDEDGKRRLDNPEDFVRLEIATALKRDIRVIPVLVDGASMPKSRDLPDDLKQLATRQGLQVGDTHYDDDCRQLVAAIEQVLEKNTAAQREREEKERLAREEKERLEAERWQKEEQDRLEAQRRETEAKKRLEAEQRQMEEQERLEAERRERKGKEQVQAEQREQKERLETQRRESISVADGSSQKMGGQIFISYRRDDASAWAMRLYDRLAARFDRRQIFTDVDTIEPGVTFVEAIEKSVGSCDVLIAVIGKSWLTSCDQEGQRRFDNRDDFVRIEIATAFKRNIQVIPVLVEGASMPLADDLPDDLKVLVRRNALQLSHDRFRTDSELLASAVERVLEKSAAERREREEKERLEADRRRKPMKNASFDIEAKKRLEAEQRQKEQQDRLETKRRETENKERRGPQRGSDLRYDLYITSEEALSGVEKQIEFLKLETCKRCGGSGDLTANPFKTFLHWQPGTYR